MKTLCVACGRLAYIGPRAHGICGRCGAAARQYELYGMLTAVSESDSGCSAWALDDNVLIAAVMRWAKKHREAAAREAEARVRRGRFKVIDP